MVRIKKYFQCKGKEFTPYNEWDDTYHFEEITKKLEKWEIRIEITHLIFNGLELEIYDRDIIPIHYELEFEENVGEMKPYQNNPKNRLLRKKGKNSLNKQELEQEIQKLKTQSEQNPNKPVWPWIIGGIGIIAVLGIVIALIRKRKRR